MCVFLLVLSFPPPPPPSQRTGPRVRAVNARVCSRRSWPLASQCGDGHKRTSYIITEHALFTPPPRVLSQVPRAARYADFWRAPIGTLAKKKKRWRSLRIRSSALELRIASVWFLVLTRSSSDDARPIDPMGLKIDRDRVGEKTDSPTLSPPPRSPGRPRW